MSTVFLPLNIQAKLMSFLNVNVPANVNGLPIISKRGYIREQKRLFIDDEMMLRVNKGNFDKGVEYGGTGKVTFSFYGTPVTLYVFEGKVEQLSYDTSAYGEVKTHYLGLSTENPRFVDGSKPRKELIKM